MCKHFRWAYVRKLHISSFALFSRNDSVGFGRREEGIQHRQPNFSFLAELSVRWFRYKVTVEHVSLKAAKYETQKPSTCRETLFRCKFWSMFPVFHLAWSTCRATKTFVAGWRKLLRKVKRGSTLSNKFWLCCSFFIKLTTCRATNLLLP